MKVNTSAVLALLVSVSLMGCAESNPLNGGNSSSASTTDQEIVENKTYTKGQIVNMALKQLKRNCTSLSANAAWIDNWELLTHLEGKPPFEIFVDEGYGAGISLLVTPTTGEPKIAISPSNYEITNQSLWYSGCSILAKDPEDSGSQQNIDQGTPAQQTVETIFVPDFIGYTEAEARSWAFNNRFKGSIMTGNTGFNPYLPCVTQKIGPVTYQSVSPGTEIENVPGTIISIDVDCEREHWVQ